MSHTAPLGLLLLLTSLGCGPVEPVYNDDLGVQAVKVEEGALAGTFAVRSVSALLIDIPFPGLENTLGGRVSYRRVERTWNEEMGSYDQRSVLCGGREFEVAGIATVIPESTYRAVPESTEEVLTVDHDRGTYTVDGQVELWAVNLDDPLNDPWIEDQDELETAEWQERVYDMDEDGEPGFTTEYTGLLGARVFTIQRRKLTFVGVTQEDGAALGVLKTGYEIGGLGGEVDDPPPEPPPGPDPPPGQPEEERGPFIQEHPDPKESWWEEFPISDSTTCDDIVQFETEGTFHRIRPF